MTQHTQWCRVAVHSDAAKKIYETYNMHRLFAGDNGIRKWFASSLADGSSDNVLYDYKAECVRHQKHNEHDYTFIQVVPTSMNECEAEVVLLSARTLSKRGFRLADPDHKHGGREVIKRLTVEDQLAQIAGRNTNLVMPWES